MNQANEDVLYQIKQLELRNFLQTYHDGVVVTNQKGVVILWNAAIEAFVGVKASEMLGKYVWDVHFSMLPRSKRKMALYRQIKKNFKTILEKGESPILNTSIHEHYDHPDGRKLSFMATVSAVKTDTGYFLVQITQDVTEQQHSLELVRENEQKFRSIIENDDDGIFLITQGGNVTEWSPAMSNMTGIEREVALDCNISDLAAGIIPAGKLGISREVVDQISKVFSSISQENPSKPDTFDLQDPYERKYVVQLRTFPIAQGETTMLCGIVRDVTDQVKSEQNARRYAYQIDTLRKVGLELSAELTFETLIWMIAPKAIELLDGTAMALYVYDPGADLLELAICLGDSQPPLEQYAARGHGLAGKVWELGDPVLLEDYHTGHTGSLRASTWGKVVGAPIFHSGEFLGVIFVFSETSFNQMDANLLGLFAAHAGSAIRNARMHAELNEFAIRDTLTTIYNRRYFFELAEKALSQAHRYKRTLCALIFDVDHFKMINDTFGHQIGDLVLYEMALRCLKEMRQNDLFGRYGGEEFAIISPDTDIEGAQVFAERLRCIIADEPFKTEKGDINVTISIGLAPLKPNSNLNNIFSEADKSLLRAKREGRNRVCVSM